MKCPKCKQEIDDSSVFCEYCGEKITQTRTEKPKIDEKPSSKKQKKIVMMIGISAAIVAVIAIVVVLLLSKKGVSGDDKKSNEPKKDVSSKVEETVEMTTVLPYHLDYSMKVPAHVYEPIKERNVLSVLVNRNAKLLVDGSIADLSSLKNEIVNFITPQQYDETAPEVVLKHFNVLGDVWVSKAVVSFQFDHNIIFGKKDNYEAFSKIINEVAKAYDQVREDLSMKMFGKHINQLTYDQISAIREAIPVRVIGVADYYDYDGCYVVENDVDTKSSEEYMNINNAFVETCMLYKDDLRGIKNLIEDYRKNTPRYSSAIEKYDSYNDHYDELGYEVVMSEENYDNEIFTIVEEMPEFPGGMVELSDYLSKNTKYPQIARECNIQGRVFVSFVVEPDGSLSNIQVLRGIGGGCDEEAIRVVENMPKWKPGKQRGKPVRVSYNLPVKFQLQ